MLAYAAPKRARAARAGSSPRRAGAASSSSPTPRGCWSSGWATAPRGSRPSSTGSRCGPSPGGEVTRERPRGDGRRHLRGGRLGALGRDRRPRPGRGARGRRAAGRPGRGGHAADLPGGASACARRTRRSSCSRRGARRSEVEAALAMHPYAAKMLVRRLRGPLARRDPRRRPARSPTSSGGPRGGSDYPERVALTLAVRRAAGVGAGASRGSAGGAARGCARGAGLLAGAGVRVQRALLDRLVDPRARARGARLGGRASSPDGDRRLEAPEVRLHGALSGGGSRSCSRWVRAMRFFCEAMLAIGRRRTIAGPLDGPRASRPR